MLFLRLLRLLLWPIRVLVMPLRRVTRLSRGVKAAGAAGETLAADGAGAADLAAPAMGIVGLMQAGAEPQFVDVYQTVFFKRFTCPPSDEPDIRPDDLDIAQRMAARARKFYELRPPLFPPEDIFYEEIEQQYVDEVCRIDNEGGNDQFFNTLDEARRVTNDNTRTLLVEIAPIVLFVVTLALGLLVLIDPLGVSERAFAVLEWRSYVRPDVLTYLFIAGGVILAGFIVMLAIYRFSYSHVQRENCLSLDNFITTEFARLNNQFRVAQRESLQAETQLSDAQREEIRQRSSSWALSYHWIGVRQLMEEMVVRNNMFQIRRNTSFYLILGVTLCLAVAGVVLGALEAATGILSAQAVRPTLAVQLTAAAVIYVILVYAVAVRNPFAIVVSSLRKDEWNRFDTLNIGEAIAEQVSRDKVQIVINRDRARAGVV